MERLLLVLEAAARRILRVSPPADDVRIGRCLW